jgi:hypothetical protein
MKVWHTKFGSHYGAQLGVALRFLADVQNVRAEPDICAAPEAGSEATPASPKSTTMALEEAQQALDSMRVCLQCVHALLGIVGHRAPINAALDKSAAGAANTEEVWKTFDQNADAEDARHAHAQPASEAPSGGCECGHTDAESAAASGGAAQGSWLFEDVVNIDADGEAGNGWDGFEVAQEVAPSTHCDTAAELHNGCAREATVQALRCAATHL